MNAKQFSDLIRDPKKIHDVEASDLKRMAHEYPYSQAVQFAYAFRLKNSGEHLFNQQLGRASIITEDRSILFDFFEDSGSTVSVSGKSAPPAEMEVKSIPSSKEEIKQESTKQKPKEEKFSDPSVSKPIRLEQGVENEPLPEPIMPKGVESQKPEAPTPSSEPQTAAEKIKAILDNSRKLQAAFEQKKSGEGQVNDRVKAIREQLEKIKSSNSNAKPSLAEDPIEKEVESESVEVKPEYPRTETIQISKEELSVLKQSETPKESQEPAPIFEESSIQASPETLLVEDKELREEREEFSNALEDVEDFKVKEEFVFVIDDINSEKEESNYEEIKEDETHNFYDWFKRLENSQGTRAKEKKPETSKLEDKIELFDSFVNKLPELKKNRNVPAPKRAEGKANTEAETGALVTETLANVYISQGHFDKAMKAYQILKLKYPEKSSFFADRIQEIKKLKNSK